MLWLKLTRGGVTVEQCALSAKVPCSFIVGREGAWPISNLKANAAFCVVFDGVNWRVGPLCGELMAGGLRITGYFDLYAPMVFRLEGHPFLVDDVPEPSTPRIELAAGPEIDSVRMRG